MSARRILPSSRVLPSPDRYASELHRAILDEVIAAVERDAVVIVGMAWNPSCGTARKAFSSRGIEHTYLEYGNYLSKWRERLVIKQWSGWPLYPQVFVHGVLVGGAARTGKAFESGLIQRLLDAGRDGVEAVVAQEWASVS